jgi:hypothetical protein
LSKEEVREADYYRLLRVVADTEEDGLLADTIATTYGVGAPLATEQASQTHSLELLRQKPSALWSRPPRCCARLGWMSKSTCAAGVQPT